MEGGQRVSLTLPHPTQYVPVRTAALLALIVLVLNIVLVWSALALRPAAAGRRARADHTSTMFRTRTIRASRAAVRTGTY